MTFKEQFKRSIRRVVRSMGVGQKCKVEYDANDICHSAATNMIRKICEEECKRRPKGVHVVYTRPYLEVYDFKALMK